MLFDLETARVPEGTVLLIGAQYRNSETGQLYPKIWTYAALKAGGRWYLTGTGKVPQDAGWGAVKRWLASHGREVVWIKMATELETLWQASDPADEADLAEFANNLRNSEHAARCAKWGDDQDIESCTCGADPA